MPTAPTTGTPSTEEAVRELFQKLLDFWGRGDGAAYGDLFTADADYVAFDGSQIMGRDQIGDRSERPARTTLQRAYLRRGPGAGPKRTGMRGHLRW